MKLKLLKGGDHPTLVCAYDGEQIAILASNSGIPSRDILHGERILTLLAQRDSLLTAAFDLLNASYWDDEEGLDNACERLRALVKAGTEEDMKS